MGKNQCLTLKKGGIVMYAIAFDLEQDTLSKTYGGPTYTNAYADIKRVLATYGFSR